MQLPKTPPHQRLPAHIFKQFFLQRFKPLIEEKSLIADYQFRFRHQQQYN